MKVGVLINKTQVDDSVGSVFVEYLKNADFSVTEFSRPQEVDGVSVAVILGGDGTILHAVEHLSPKGIQIIGVNFGTLGFLSEFEKDDYAGIVSLLNELKNGECSILKRSLLQAECNGKVYHALNEIVLRREYSSPDKRMLKTGIEIDGEEGESLLGDGVLLCTPTGSTAYSLSAGGPILDPHCPVYMLTPICAFSLKASPVVVPNGSVTKLKMIRSDALLIVDGKVCDQVGEGSEVVVSLSPFTANFPVCKTNNFHKKIWLKLK